MKITNKKKNCIATDSHGSSIYVVGGHQVVEFYGSKRNMSICDNMTLDEANKKCGTRNRDIQRWLWSPRERDTGSAKSAPDSTTRAEKK